MSNTAPDIGELPRFSEFDPRQVEPEVTRILAQIRAETKALIEHAGPYTWDNFIRPLDELNERLEKFWAPVAHLHSAQDTEELRGAYNACLPLISEYYTEQGQNKGLYSAYKAIADSHEYTRLHHAQQKNIQDRLRDFRLSGIELPADKQARYKDIQQRLSKLSSRFSENVLDATNAWKKHCTDESLLSGLPDTVKGLLRQQAQQEGLEEGWLLNLEAPCYLPVMQYAEHRPLREEMYRAYMTRASETGPHAGQWDNAPVMAEIMDLRQENAQLLGFANYAEYSLETKMARNTGEVLDFLNDLSERSKPVAQRDLAELQAFVRDEYGIDTLEVWDIPYYSEKLRLHRYALSEEDLRPYFPLPQVLHGLFEVARRLYGIQVKAEETKEIWHPDVRFFHIYDEQNQLRGRFYLDLYARKGKRGGAWMGDLLSRKHYGDSTQIPIAYLICNFPQPVREQPSLLTHRDVTTLFHEFGHGLHHMLTQVDYPGVSGINGVPWDAVELPSQIMENWCWEHEALQLFARHYQTDEVLPQELLDKMLAAKNFQAGLFMVRQLEFALFDFKLHMDYQAGGGARRIQEILDAARQQTAVLFPPKFNRFQNGFGHIFAGGYAAGYYSYKWAEVLSADAFSCFEENGVFDSGSGRRFLHTFLEQGGSREPMELFVEFRGREPQIDALLRHNGIQF